MSTTNVVITGANRGIGKGLLQRYLQRPAHVVVATVRDPSASAARELANLPCAEGSRLIVVKMDVAVEADVLGVARDLWESHGVDHLDLVVANAGISNVWPLVADLKIDQLRSHLEPNVYGVIYTYQALRPLLQKAAKEPSFFTIGSAAGCMTRQPPFPNAAYGPTKALVNWFTMKIDAEDPWLNAFAVAPGLVATDLGNTGARALTIPDEYIVDLDLACDSIVRIATGSSKEKHGGKLVNLDGEISAW